MNFSLEIGLKTDLSNLPKVKDVYITLLPGEDFRQVVNKAKELTNTGAYKCQKWDRVCLE